MAVATLNTRVSDKMYDQFRHLAERNDRSLSAEVRVAIREHLRKNEPGSASNAPGSDTKEKSLDAHAE